MRTIDANALMNELIRLGYAYSNEEQRAVVADCIECVEEAPTVKAMEATRCRDCVNCQRPVHNWWYCKMTGLTVSPDGFCDCGETKPAQVGEAVRQPRTPAQRKAGKGDGTGR